MSGPRLPDDERLLDLLTQQATEGLSAGDAAELEQLLARHPGTHADALGLATAAADLAFQQTAGLEAEPLPEALRRRIVTAARQHETFTGSASVVPFDASRPARASAAGKLASAGWYVAAAILVLGFFLWPASPDRDIATESGPSERRARLLETEPDALRISWGTPAAEGFQQVRGDVVWSNARQAGFLRLRGMPANRPTEQQYQLWIVDPRRDKNPIDGGVFDIPGGADEVIVPIDAKLDVIEPQAFAITLEQPGGVVVSAGPLLVVAAV